MFHQIHKIADIFFKNNLPLLHMENIILRKTINSQQWSNFQLHFRDEYA
jgi:hypothetical protein